MHPSRRLKAVAEKDGRKCWLCGQRVDLYAGKDSTVRASFDHVVEKRNGGWDSRDNLRVAHRFCNSVRAHYPDPSTHPNYEAKVAYHLRRRHLWREPDPRLHRVDEMLEQIVYVDVTSASSAKHASVASAPKGTSPKDSQGLKTT